MPTNKWTPKTNYYVELNQGQLKQVLGEVLEDIMKYNPRKDGQEWILEYCMRGVKYLAGNKVAISIQITNAAYVEYEMTDGKYENIMDVITWIDEEDFELAKYMFNVEEFLSEEEYKELESIEQL